MAILYLTCGCPGSGKSTWVQKHMNPETDKWVSRDAIRFSLLGEKDDYFRNRPRYCHCRIWCYL